MTFSEKLQQLRKDQRLSQEELADRLEVSRQAISKWEVGEVPNLENLIKISKFFGCTLDYLVNDDAESGGQEAAGEVSERARAEAPAGTQAPTSRKRRFHLPSLLLGAAIPLVILAAAALIRSANPPKRAMVDDFNGWWLLYMDWPGYDEPDRKAGHLMVEGGKMHAYLDGDRSTASINASYTYKDGLLDMDVAPEPFVPVIESSNRVVFAPPNSWRWKLIRPDFKNGDIFETSSEWEHYELAVDPEQKEFDVTVSCELGTIDAQIIDEDGETIRKKQTLIADSEDPSFTMHIRREEGYTGSYLVKMRGQNGFPAAGWYAWE